MKEAARKFSVKKDYQIKNVVYSKGTKKTAKGWCNLLSWNIEYFLDNYNKSFTKVSNVKPKTENKTVKTTKVTVPVKVMQRCLDHIILFTELEALRQEKNNLLALNNYEGAAEIRRQEQAALKSFPKLKELKALRSELN